MQRGELALARPRQWGCVAGSTGSSFPTKPELLDALFADGFAQLRRRFDQLEPGGDPVDGVVDVARAFVEHLVARLAAYHLMFQGTVPGFQPSQASHAIALSVLQELIDRLAAVGGEGMVSFHLAKGTSGRFLLRTGSPVGSSSEAGGQRCQGHYPKGTILTVAAGANVLV
jgi:AcrR family transcriptional regulator